MNKLFQIKKAIENKKIIDNFELDKELENSIIDSESSRLFSFGIGEISKIDSKSLEIERNSIAMIDRIMNKIERKIERVESNIDIRKKNLFDYLDEF